MPDNPPCAECLSHLSPAELTPGGRYLFFPPGGCVNKDHHELVTLVGFTPYPATVIVLDRRNRRLYCDRGHLRCLPGGWLSTY